MNSLCYSRLASGGSAGYRACLIAVAVGLLLSGCPAASAQSIFASLSGTVADTSGAVVPGAKVTVENTATKVVRQYVTNSSGYFAGTQLPTGTYSVSAEAKGFEKWQATGIVLSSSDDKTLTIPLKIGAESETVSVTAGIDQIAIADTGDRVNRIDSEQLDHLSLVGRNATEYLKILPGAALSANGGLNKLGYTGEVVGINGFAVGNNAGGLAGVSINGQTGTGVSITQDGQNVMDPGAPGSATPVNPNPDMISEVTVLTSNFGAENAKGPVVVNTVTKSGGSTFHGDGHFYARNSAMNSEDSFNKAVESDPTSGFKAGQLKIPSNYYYPGFTVGGPVIIPGTSFNKNRNKYFFHEGFENYRQLIDGGINRAFVPTADMLNGDWSALNTYGSKVGRFAMGTVPTAPSPGSNAGFDARAGCALTDGKMSQACIDPNAQLYMSNNLPAATSATPNGQGFNYIAPVQERQNSTQNVVRGDVNFTDNTKVYVTWNRQRETAQMPLGLWNNPGDWVVPAPSQSIGNNTSDFYAVNFLHIFSPTLTVEARYGYTHVDFPTKPKSPEKILRKDMNFPLTGVFANPNTPVMLSWSQSIPNLGDIGHDYHPTMIATKGIPSTSADITKVFKTHTAKFGYSWEHTYNKQDNWGQYMGVYTYSPWGGMATGNNYADMLMGIGFQGYFEQALPPPTNIAANVLDFYATDHWRINRHISVDYGMRFEHNAKAYADNPYGLAIFDTSKYQVGVKNSGISWHGLDHRIPKSGTTAEPLFFSPRFGASIDLFGNGRTVFRGGWGKYRYYDTVQSNSYTGPAGTAQGSVGWSCGSSSDCMTWESVDAHVNTGGSCAAGTNCAPVVVYGQQPDFTNTTFAAADKHNHQQPLVTSYSLNIDQLLPNRFMFEIAYVGNNADFTQAQPNINSVPLGALNDKAALASKCGASADPNNGTCQQKFRPYPDYQTINSGVSAGKAQYDAMQVSLTRSSGWLTVSTNYTFAKTLSNSTTAGAFKDYGIHEYWSVQPYDRAHVFNASYVFQLPKTENGNRIVRGIANGWEFSGITQLESGAQVSATNGANFGLNGASSGVALVGTPDITAYATMTCDPKSGLKSHQFVNPDCFRLPAAGEYGSGRIPYLAGPMFWNSDATIVKNFTVTEHQHLEVRFSAFNFMNHDLLSFSNGDSNLKLNFDSSTGELNNATDTKHTCPGPQCAAFGYADYHFGHRILEMGAKYTF